MKNEQTIALLRREQESLKTVNSATCSVWKTHMKSYIKTFFGEHSPQFKYISDYQFWYNYNQPEAETKANIPIMSLFVETCIDTITNIGLYKPPKQNFLSRISDGLLAAIIGIAVPALFIGGTLWGKYLSDVQNIELKQENKQLMDKLSDGVSPLPNANPIPFIDTNGNSNKSNNVDTHSRKKI